MSGGNETFEATIQLIEYIFYKWLHHNPRTNENLPKPIPPSLPHLCLPVFPCDVVVGGIELIVAKSEVDEGRRSHAEVSEVIDSICTHFQHLTIMEMNHTDE